MLCYDNSEMLRRLMKAMTYKKPNKKPEHKPLLLTSPKQRQGSHYEHQACEYLQAKGLILIAQNWQQPKIGELDLVMLETGKSWSTLVFIEVRQRRISSFGDAALSITAAKRNRIIKTAKYFLQQHPNYADYECRFDVIAYDTTDTHRKLKDAALSAGPEWLQGAFAAQAW
ncbi:YraN family protein [Psychrobacter sp. 1U2]|uniref:YraN family protein n=1 Tax=Psychrobacter sp. 1U2 TaxID=3453577 RepID=UPI003F4650B7